MPHKALELSRKADECKPLGGGGGPARNLRLSSFSDPNAPVGQALQTSIALDTAEAGAYTRSNYNST